MLCGMGSSIISNAKDKTYVELVEKYRELWQIEEAFRIFINSLSQNVVPRHFVKYLKLFN